MTIHLKLLACLVMLGLASYNVAVASDTQSRFVTYGSGAKKCKVIGSSASDIDSQVTAWIAGYVTAQNERVKGIADVVADKNLETVLTLISKFCVMHPDAKVVDAAGVVVAQKMDEARERLEKQSQRLRSPIRKMR